MLKSVPAWIAGWPLAVLAAGAPLNFTGAARTTQALSAGQMVQVRAGLPKPSELPANGRIAIIWQGPKSTMRKVIHALDPDLFFVFRAPAPGVYTLKAEAVQDEEPIFNLPRWRETGIIQKLDAFPRRTPWPPGHRVQLDLSVATLPPGGPDAQGDLEYEPNNSIAEAQPVSFGDRAETLHILGGADDLEYFDNGEMSREQGLAKAGDDWFRLEYKGSKPRLFTANLNVIDPLVVLQVRMYTADGKEYRDGANPNERVHQQLEGHRSALTRRFHPGGVYYLRVESNSPGYDLELRTRDLAPHADPRAAVRAAMYDHMTQVDAWLLNRPRGAAVDRRIRETGSLLGTHCMSCHTQSGVWGPVGGALNGYRIETVGNLRHLVNTMYECLRPTNHLAEAANNTSLSPLDLGDGPAGTRVAGYNLVMAERLMAPRRLHAAQQQRTANFMLQSADPSGINAAGPGSNVGQVLVYRFSAEILLRAWRDTRNEKYLKAFDEKVELALGVTPRYSDDYSNRVEFFLNLLPDDYPQWRGEETETRNRWVRARAQAEADLAALRAIQRPDGSWGFSPKPPLPKDEKDADPAPTALALTALAAGGADASDPQVAKGVAWLLANQDSHGRWNRAALTGFVTTAYAIHALSRLYPARDQTVIPPAPPNASLANRLARMRALAHLGVMPGELDLLASHLPELLAAARDPQPFVRYWAAVALGALHDERGVAAQLDLLGDPVKMVREAARWGLRQTLLDDKGWDQFYPAYATASDLAREQMAAALVMRADSVMPRSNVGYARFTALLDRMMNQDAAPAVRAWSKRAAWNWWVWNPPVRAALNQSFLASLERAEPNALAETALRYQTEALFIANGQKANPSQEHQYPELRALFAAISKRLDDASSEKLIERLAGIAATYYSQAGGDGGPGQMGYVTEHSSAMMGKAVLAYWNQAEKAVAKDRIRFALEAAANIVHEPLQKRLLDYSTTGPEEFRTLASTSISDPRLITLNAAQEFVEPLMEQFYRGAREEERRAEVSQPIVKLFSRARWNLPKSEEQQRIFYGLLIPQFPEERGRAEENVRELKQMDKDPADWYVSRALGSILHSNTDLQTPVLLERIPEVFKTPMEELFWLPALGWLAEYGRGIPEPGAPAAEDPASKPQRDRIAKLYVRALTEKVDARLRNQAMNMAGSTAVRNHPLVAPALRKARPGYFEAEPAALQDLSPQWRKNWEYFRDYVAPEFTRANREDQMACLSCHGVPGRVPSMELAPADNLGYVKMAGLWSNYRILLERVNEQSPAASKLLRKPLNVQSGKEDGHQGGKRYSPSDRAYQILEKWVRDAASLKQREKPVALILR